MVFVLSVVWTRKLLSGGGWVSSGGNRGGSVVRSVGVSAGVGRAPEIGFRRNKKTKLRGYHV